MPSDYTQKTGRVAYSGPAASLADHDPTATMQEFLNSDRWIIPARSGEATPARSKITVRLEYDRRAAARNRHGRGEDVA